MKILVLDAHPYDESYCSSLAQKYAEGAKNGGHEVKIISLRNLKFDPILHYGYSKPMELEPDLANQQELLLWCDHLVIVTPLWWSSPPALLKGYIDRVFLPSFAFKYVEGKPLPEKLLTGKSARVIYTQSAPFLYSFLAYGDAFWKLMKKGFLEFCGFKPVKRIVFDLIDKSKIKKRQTWLNKVYQLGLKGL